MAKVRSSTVRRLAVVIATVAIAGCSTGTPASSTGTPTSLPAASEGANPTVAASTLPAVTYPDATFTVGMIGDFTGQAGVYGQPAKNAGELAISDVNQGGGVWGKPAKLIFGEAASSPQQALSEAQRLTKVEGAQILQPTIGSGGCLAVKEGVTTPDKILTFGSHCLSPVHTADQSGGTGYFFRIRPPVAAMMGAIARLAQADGAKNVCVIYVNNAYGQGALASFQDLFKGLVPDASIQSQGIPDATATTYLSELTTCVANGHDSVVLAAYGAGEADVVMKDGAENRIVKKFYMDEDQEDPSIFKNIGWEPFNGLIGFTGSGIPGPGLTYYLDAYKRTYGGTPDTPLSEMSYDATFLGALAAAKANSSSSSDIRNSVYDVANAPGEKVGPGPDEFKKALALIAAGEDIDYTGVSGTIEFDPQGQNLTGGSKMWHVDAAAKTLPVDGYVLYDAQAKSYTFTPADGCKYCKPW